MIETFGTRLRKLREGKGYKQEHLAKFLNVNKSAVSYYEADTRQPSKETIVRIAVFFNVTTDYLLGVQNDVTIDCSGLYPDELRMIREQVAYYRERNKQWEKAESMLKIIRRGLNE